MRFNNGLTEAYEEWNEKAIEYFFSPKNSGSISSLDVSDKCLRQISTTPLLNTVKQLFREIDSLKLEGEWRFQAQVGCPPTFFAFLLATCRIEWERESGEFATDFRRKLGVGSNPWIGMLPELWIGLKKFLYTNSNKWRTLILPSNYSRFNRIGHSIGLVFPRRRDRRLLERMFTALGELEPSIPSVCKSLESIRGELSPECREEADWFRENVGSNKEDVRTIRFRQILRQTLDNSDLNESNATNQASITLAFCCDEDEIVEPWALLRDDAEIPPKFTVIEESEGITGWNRILLHSDREESSGLFILNNNCDNSPTTISSRTINFIQEGAIPLIRAETMGEIDWLIPADRLNDSAHAYLLHNNHELVKHLLSKGINTEKVQGCEWVSCFKSDEVSSKENKKRLVKRAPKIKVQGIKFRKNQFINIPGFRPSFSFQGANKFELYCLQGSEDSLQGVTNIDGLEGEFLVRAVSDEKEVLSEIRVSLINKLPLVLTADWSKLTRSYWVPAPTVQSGGRSSSESHPTFLLTKNKECNTPPDTTLWQSDEIWLGPRVGDVSIQRQPGFDWRLVESDDGNQRLLSFEGANPSNAKPDISAMSTNKRACRLWRRTFDPNKTICQNPKWKEAFASYGVIRNPANHKKILGGEVSKFQGEAPPPRKRIQFKFSSVSIDNRVNFLESVFRARISGKSSPLCWQVLWTDFLKAFELSNDSTIDRHLTLNLIRTWQETGVIDIVSKTWGGLSCVIRRPHFVIRQVEGSILGTLVGLTNERLRNEIQKACENNGWEWTTKFSTSSYVPPILELRILQEIGITELNKLSKTYGFSPPKYLQWEDVDRLPACIPQLGQFEQYFNNGKEALPVSEPINERSIEGSAIKILKYNPKNQPPIWSIGPFKESWAICTSSDWAWRLACLAVTGTLPFTYSNGRIMRTASKSEIPTQAIYLPLEVGRLLTIISPRLPGPVHENSYEYYTPSQLSGTLIADRLSIAKI